jgi:hypothetical protein
VLKYDPQRATEPPIRPRTEEDFQADLRALKDVVSKVEDPVEKGVTWYTLKTGFAVAYADRKVVKRIAELLGEADFVVSGIALGKDKVWLGTNKGLFVWNRRDMFWTRFAIDGKFIDLPVKELSLDEAGKLLITIEQARSDGQAAKSRRFEYDCATAKWRELT